MRSILLFMFDASMKLNKVISVFLLALFLTNFIVVDAKIRLWTMDKDAMVRIDPLCKKQNSTDSGTDTEFTGTSLPEASYLIAPCTTVLQLKEHQWHLVAEEIGTANFNLDIPFVDGLYHDRNYPPPKAV